MLFVGVILLVDQRVKKIFQLSRRSAHGPTHVNELESLFASVSCDCFATPPEQPNELANYGFGLRSDVQTILPYCVSHCSRQLFYDRKKYPKMSKFLEKIDPYPILAGSAVFLGADHAICDDVDLVKYMTIGTTQEERSNVGLEFRRLIKEMHPTSLKASLNNAGNDKPKPPVEAIGSVKIRQYLDKLVGNNVDNPDPQLVARLKSAQLIWSAETMGLNKQITLKVHFVHSAFPNSDIHPYQEVHECAPNDFLHTNRHWLAPSFCGYFGFLLQGIQDQLVKNDPIKAAKRAAILFGIVGCSVSQKEIIQLLDNYPNLDPADKVQRRKQMIAKIGGLQQAAASVYNSMEAR